MADRTDEIDNAAHKALQQAAFAALKDAPYLQRAHRAPDKPGASDKSSHDDGISLVDDGGELALLADAEEIVRRRRIALGRSVASPHDVAIRRRIESLLRKMRPAGSLEDADSDPSWDK